MTIAINTRFLLKDKLEGIGYFSHEILRRLVLAKPEITFYFLFDRPYDEQFIYADNVKPIVLSPPARHPILFYMWFEWSIPWMLRRIKADLFISTDGFLSLRSSCKTLLWWHDLSYLKQKDDISKSALAYYRYFVPRFIRRADRILTFSQHAKQDVLHHFSISPYSIDTSYGAARHGFQPISQQQIQEIRLSLTQGEAYFLYVGAIHPRKNVHAIIRAFDHFKQQTTSSMKLLLVGRLAWKTNAVKQAFDASPYQSDIQFAGHVTTGLENIVGAAFAMVYPSFYEGFGLPVIEAISCHVPAITSNVSSLPEVVGDAGIQVNPHSVKELAQAMIDLVENSDLYLSKQKACLEQKLRFDWDKTVGDVCKSIDVVLSRSPM